MGERGKTDGQMERRERESFIMVKHQRLKTKACNQMSQRYCQPVSYIPVVMAQNEKQKSLRLEEIKLYPSDKYFLN